MRGKVGVRKIPKGGFGNRVISYLSIRHIAHAVNAGYFFVDPLDRQLITGIHRPSRTLSKIAQRKAFATTDIRESDFLAEVEDVVSHGHSAVLKGQILGEVLVRFAITDSRDLTQIRVRQCSIHQKNLGSRKLITAHFRAGDFREWEPAAILPAPYYLSALDSLGSLSADDWRVRICVDDSSHPALETVQQHLRARGLLLEVPDCSRPFECDLAAMSHSDYLISSPSTFALVAGLLGKSRIIHSAEWVDNRVSRGEEFWRRVGEGTFPGYALERLV